MGIFQIKKGLLLIRSNESFLLINNEILTSLMFEINYDLYTKKNAKFEIIACYCDKQHLDSVKKSLGG